MNIPTKNKNSTIRLGSLFYIAVPAMNETLEYP